MLNVYLYAGHIHTGRTYQALTDAVREAAAIAPMPPVVAFTDDSRLNDHLPDLCDDLRVNPESVTIRRMSEFLPSMTLANISALADKIPGDMVLIVDQFCDLTDLQVVALVTALGDRVKSVHWVVGAQKLNFDPLNPRWPDVLRGEGYRLHRRVCTRDQESGDYHVTDPDRHTLDSKLRLYRELLIAEERMTAKEIDRLISTFPNKQLAISYLRVSLNSFQGAYCVKSAFDVPDDKMEAPDMQMVRETYDPPSVVTRLKNWFKRLF